MPIPVDITLARSGDCQAIAEMSRRLIETGLPWSWTPARVIRHLIHPDSVVLTARAGSDIAGFAIMQFGDESAHLNLLAVDTRYQRSGIGRRLVVWLEQSAVVAGTFTVRLETRARNPVSLLFYRKLGYVEAGRIPRYYGGREDALRMMRDLRDPVHDRRRGHDEYRNSADDGSPGTELPAHLPERRRSRQMPAQSTAAWLLTRFRR